MKLNQLSNLIISAAVLLSVSASQAGDNGSSLKCSSRSGRTKVTVQMQNSKAISVNFSIDGAEQYNSSLVDNELCEVNDCETYPEVKNPEIGIADYGFGLFVMNVINPEIPFSMVRVDNKRLQILSAGKYEVSGTDPRSGKKFVDPIIVKCKSVANPI